MNREPSDLTIITTITTITTIFILNALYGIHSAQLVVGEGQGLGFGRKVVQTQLSVM